MKISDSVLPLGIFLASVVLLSLLLSSSVAATQFVLVTRVSTGLESNVDIGPFSKEQGGASTVDETSTYVHGGTKAQLCTVPSGDVPADLYASFPTYVPTMGVRFWVQAVEHGDLTKNLTLAKIQFLNPSVVTLTIVRNRLGYFSAYFGSEGATDVGIFMNTTKYYEVNVYYTTDDDVARIYVTPFGGTALLLGSRAFSPAFKGGMSVWLGIFTVESYGKVAIDDFSLYASPMLNISKPIVNSGDTVTISGVQFRGGSQVNITIRSATGQLVYSNPTISTQADGSLSQSVLLPGQMAIGLYDVVAKQTAMYSGELIFHLGVWGTSSSTVNRTVPFNITGYGAKLGSLVTLTIDKVPPPSLHVLTEGYPAYSPNGRFISSNIVMTAAQPLGLYKAKIAAQGTLDYASYSFEDEYTFTVSSAPLAVTIQTDARRYMRTQTMKASAVAKYRNGSTVSPNSNFLLNIKVGTQIVVVNTPMTYSSALGLWTYELKLSSNSPLGLNEITLSVTDPAANTGIGTTNFTVTAAAIQAQFDFDNTFQRSETINISALLTYPDNHSVWQGTFSAIARRGTISHVASMRYFPSEDKWKASITIAPSDPVGSWSLILSGADPEGNPLNVSVPFTVIYASMSVINQVDLNITYQRTTSLFFQVVVRYPSAQRMTVGTVNASISYLGRTQSYRSPLSFIPTAQAWRGYLRIPANAPEGMYNVVVNAVDPSGNQGNLSRMVNVVKATLTVDIRADRREFQVGFDTIKFSGGVYYPDGTTMTNGSVTLEVAVGANRKVIDMQQSTPGAWTATMQTGFFDSGGEYSILVRASDGLGNSGSTTFPLTASQLYVILSLGGVALSLAIAIALIWRFRQSRGGGAPTVGVEYEHYL